MLTWTLFTSENALKCTFLNSILWSYPQKSKHSHAIKQGTQNAYSRKIICEFLVRIQTSDSVILQSKIKQQWNTENFSAPTYGYKISNKMEFSPQMCRSMQQHKPSSTTSSGFVDELVMEESNIMWKTGRGQNIVPHTFLQDGFLTKFKGVGIESSQNCWFYFWPNILWANFQTMRNIIILYR